MLTDAGAQISLHRIISLSGQLWAGQKGKGVHAKEAVGGGRENGPPTMNEHVPKKFPNGRDM